MSSVLIFILNWPSWWAASLIANVAIQRTEYLNRMSGAEHFLSQLPQTWWLILIAQWGLFNSWSGAPSLMIAWAWFTCVNNLVRLGSAQWALGESPNAYVILGTGMMFAAAWIVKMGSVASS